MACSACVTQAFPALLLVSVSPRRYRKNVPSTPRSCPSDTQVADTNPGYCSPPAMPKEGTRHGASGDVAVGQAGIPSTGQTLTLRGATLCSVCHQNLAAWPQHCPTAEVSHTWGAVRMPGQLGIKKRGGSHPSLHPQVTVPSSGACPWQKPAARRLLLAPPSFYRFYDDLSVSPPARFPRSPKSSALSAARDEEQKQGRLRINTKRNTMHEKIIIMHYNA